MLCEFQRLLEGGRTAQALVNALQQACISQKAFSAAAVVLIVAG
jgi:hypothetical protein